MGQDHLKQTNVSELPETGDILADDYLIVQGKEVTARIKFKDIYITKENTTFGQEINDLYEKVEALSDLVGDSSSSAEVYTKSEIDEKLTAKANTASSLTASEIQDQYHDKKIVDAKIQSRAAKIDVYTKSEAEALVSGLKDQVSSFQKELQDMMTRVEYLEGLHDMYKENHFVPVIDYNDLINKPS